MRVKEGAGPWPYRAGVKDMVKPQPTGPARGAIRIVHRSRTGRVRLRIKCLRDNGAILRRLALALCSAPGVLSAEPRVAAGSVVLRVEPGLSDADLLDRAGEALAVALSGRALSAPASAGPPDGPDWHSRDLGEVLDRLGVDPETGLPDAEAEARLTRTGENRLPRDRGPTQFSLFAEQFQTLPVALLVTSSILSLTTRNVIDAVATLSVVGANAVLGYVTEAQAEAAIHKLMDTKTANASVLRGGRERRVTSGALVPGDVISVRAGQQAPADIRLIDAHPIKADESALTGETLPVEKTGAGRVAFDAPVGERPTMLHSGTIVVEGRGRGVVVSTGGRTVMADIAGLSSGTERPRAPVEVELDVLSGQLVKLALLACGAFFGIGLARGVGAAAIFKDALALAVASVPEGLPVVATTTMSLGLRRMERKGILVRQVGAVETLGAVQTICLDKTGTLTQNRLSVSAVVPGRGPADEPGAATKRLAEAAALNNDATMGNAGAEGSSATERALMDFALAHGVDAAALLGKARREATQERSVERPWMATRHRGRRPPVIVKGAPDSVLAMCSHYLSGGRRRPLGDEARARILALNDDMAARPSRVIGFADGPASADLAAPEGLTWLGLVAMSDPIRPGSRDFVASMHRAGLRTVMITGDQVATAAAIARELDLSNGASLRIVDAPRLGGLDPDVLAGIARQTHVFSRVTAQQKLRIVQALQASGEIVAMTGDGINDGPALKAANVGIAMGASGTDLARDVANVVIRDDELGTLVNSVAQGRSVYRNIRRALSFLITTNLSEILVSLVEAAHGPGELETPMELLWINLASDVLPGLGLALADPDADVMERPPRRPDEPIIAPPEFRRMLLDGATISAASLVSHFAGLARYGPGPQTRSMTFISLSLGQLIYTLFCQRSDIRHIRPGRLLENRTLDGAVLVSSGVAMLPFFVPGLRRALGLGRIGAGATGFALGTALVPAAAVLARRGVRLQLGEVEGRPCETS